MLQAAGHLEHWFDCASHAIEPHPLLLYDLALLAALRPFASVLLPNGTASTAICPWRAVKCGCCCCLQGEAGSGKAGGLGQRLSMMLRGRKLAADRIAVDAGVSQALLDDAARQMEGFSGREIAKFMASVQAAVYGSAQAVLTPEIFK